MYFFATTANCWAFFHCARGRATWQDCAHDTWIKLAQFRDRTRPDNDRAYVFRVAANIATDWHRRRSLN